MIRKAIKGPSTSPAEWYGASSAMITPSKTPRPAGTVDTRPSVSAAMKIATKVAKPRAGDSGRRTQMTEAATTQSVPAAMIWATVMPGLGTGMLAPWNEMGSRRRETNTNQAASASSIAMPMPRVESIGKWTASGRGSGVTASSAPPTPNSPVQKVSAVNATTIPTSATDSPQSE